MIIYKTTNLINGKCYIGLHNKEDDNYLGSGKILQQAIKKYGRENFVRETLETCSNDDHLRERETYWIEKYDAVNSDMFYNIAPGGRGGDNGVKVKMSKHVKKVWDSYSKEEKKARIKNSNWGKYDKSGCNNPRAKEVLVIDELGERIYKCLKDYAKERNYPYSVIKGLFSKFKNSDYKNNDVRSKYTNIISIKEYANGT